MACEPEPSKGSIQARTPGAAPAPRRKTALITGANGGVGTLLRPALVELGYTVCVTDIDTMDVRNLMLVETTFRDIQPDVVFHLAGRKLAVEGELEPEEFARTNVLGTANVTAQHVPVVFASTCKAADPETAYGASKLIAERIVLNRGGTVVRLFNILHSGPSVLDVWKQIPDDDPIPFTDCWRYFISTGTAVQALITASTLPPGRYAPDPGPARHMRDVAAEYFPGRRLIEIPRRRGDRAREPLHALCERATQIGQGLLCIQGAHDPELARRETRVS